MTDNQKSGWRRFLMSRRGSEGFEQGQRDRSTHSVEQRAAICFH